MKRKKILVLGATGSIGKNAAELLRSYPALFKAVGFSAHTNAVALRELGDEFNARALALSGENENADSFPFRGASGLLRMIEETDADVVVNGVAGSAGLAPSVAALENSRTLALANKETMIMAGDLIKRLAKKKDAKIIPVDSEHSAVFVLQERLKNRYKSSIAEIILTASGGPFRTWTKEEIARAGLSDALKHPTWSMGKKITVDSASLANKGLEVLEACSLFDVPARKITVTVHPQSVIHSMIRLSDNTVYAQLSKPDMKHPLFTAMTWPHCVKNELEKFSFDAKRELSFEPPRMNDFPMLALAYEAAERRAAYPAAYNAANERAVQAFLSQQIGFGDIPSITEGVLRRDWSKEPASFDDVYAVDREAKKYAELIISKITK